MPALANAADFQVLVPVLFRQKKVQQVSSHLSCCVIKRWHENVKSRHLVLIKTLHQPCYKKKIQRLHKLKLCR